MVYLLLCIIGRYNRSDDVATPPYMTVDHLRAVDCINSFEARQTIVYVIFKHN